MRGWLRLINFTVEMDKTGEEGRGRGVLSGFVKLYVGANRINQECGSELDWSNFLRKRI